MKSFRNILLLILIVVFAGCEDLLYDNKNPDKASAITPEQILPVIVFYASQINYDHAEYGVYLSQNLTTGGRSQKNATAYKGGWEFLTMNRHPQWRRHFYDIGANINELILAADRVGSKNTLLIARTIRLMSTQLTTDAFGDMPRSEAYLSNSPKYDTQESIYQWMIEEADELIKLYDDPEWTENPGDIKITQKMDRIYSGDLKKWRQFTCALKARILLRKLPNWENNSSACNQIIKAVDDALIDWNEPIYKYDGGSGVSSCPWGPAQPAINLWESRQNLLDKAIISKYFSVDMMGVYASVNPIRGYAEDPRLAALMNPRVGADGRTIMRYIECNIGMDITARESHYPDLYATALKDIKNPYTSNDGYIPLFLTEELMLIKAEALYWSGQKDPARLLTIEAAKVNMERLNAVKAHVDRYLAMDKYFPETDFSIGHIMRQKYVCMYLQPEQWTDMRRYNYSNDNNKITYDGYIVYPGLRRPYNLYEPYWMVDKNPDGSTKEVWIHRINYDPQTEEKYNKKELERLGAFQNPDWLKKPMIWAINNQLN